MTAVSISVQPKIFSDRETAISCLVVPLLRRVLPHRLLCCDDKEALPFQAIPGFLQRIPKAFAALALPL